MTTAEVTFAGLRVASFESRRADDIARMIAKKGGVPLVSPSMREVPLAQNQAAVDFANRLVTGQIDVVIFLTGRRHAASASTGRAARRPHAISRRGERRQDGRPRPEAARGAQGSRHHANVDRAGAEHLARTAHRSRSAFAGGQSGGGIAGIRHHESELDRRARGPRSGGRAAARLRLGLAGRRRSARGKRATDRRRRGRCGHVYLAATSAQPAEGGRRSGHGRRIEGWLPQTRGRFDRPDHQRDAPREQSASRHGAVASEDGSPGAKKPPSAPRYVLTRKRQLVTIRNPQSAIHDQADAPWHDSMFLRACRRETRRLHARVAHASGRPLHAASIARFARR